ncbi:hypothetical protein K8R04_03305 [Candidatus Uhrbacteria bacterium]|nr:hypothetical protein [Candidatus Uhrbacteria bacterium]
MQVNVETTEMYHVYRGEKLVAYVIAMDGNGQAIKELLEPTPERRVRSSGISAVKTAERLDQLVPDDPKFNEADDGPPTKRLGIPVRNKT